MRHDIEMLTTAFCENDLVDRIYINFCNPWPKERHKKHRLTSPKQLRLYAGVMNEGAQLRFKTDDDELYQDTKEYLAGEDWTIVFDSPDFEKQPMPDNIETEHEQMFIKLGKKIKGIIALPPQKATDS